MSATTLSPDPAAPGWWRPVWLCLAGEQPLPNVLPMLARLPEKVVFFHTEMPASRASASRCAQYLETLGVKVRTHQIPAFDAAKVSEAVVQVGAQQDLGRVLLNYTGGTKVMSLAAYQALPPHIPRIYFDSRVGLSVNQGPFMPLAHPPLTVMGILSLHASVEDVHAPANLPPPAPATSRVLVEAIREEANRVSVLLAYREKHLKKLRKGRGWASLPNPLPVPFEGRNPRLAADLQEAMGQDGLLVKGATEFSPTASGLSFLEGFWWERFVEAQIREGFRGLGIAEREVDLQTNLTVRWTEAQQQTTNEFDLVFTYRDRLFIISCTTASESETEKRRHQVEALVERLGGHLGKGMVACTSTPDVIRNLQARASSRVLLANTRDWLEPANLLRTWLEQ